MIPERGAKLSELQEKAWLCLAVAVVAVMFTTAAVWASKMGRILTDEEISTVWIGISEDELSLLRLRLQADGTGSGGYLYRGRKPQLFKITSWSHGRRFVAKVEFAEEPGNFSEVLFGELMGARMSIRISGNGWEQQIPMRMENRLLKDWTILAAATGCQFPLNPPDTEEVSAAQ